MSNYRKMVLLVALFLFGVAAGAQVSDTTPPRLVEFSISPTTVDVSTNFKVITLTARITDDLSGFGAANDYIPSWSFGNVAFTTMNANNIPVSLTARFKPEARISGNALDGIYKAELIVPQRTQTGIWSVASFVLGDEVRNATNYFVQQMRGLGLPFSFTVTGGVEDREPPEALALTLGSTAVDTSTNIALIPVAARVRENVGFGGGFDSEGRPIPTVARVNYISPSQRQTAYGSLMWESGDINDAVFNGVVFLPRFSEPGVWQLQHFQIGDGAGNRCVVDLATALAKGFPTEITVSGVGDTNAPTLRAFGLSTRWIAAPTNFQTIAASVRITDDLSGLGGGYDLQGRQIPPGPMWLEFTSPSGQSFPVPLSAESRGPEYLDVVFNGELMFPRFCETGVWRVRAMALRDGVGNRVDLDAARLRELGFPTEIAVGVEPRINVAKQGDAILLSWPRWAESFQLQARGGVGGAAVGWFVAPAKVGDQLVVSLPSSEPALFFFLGR